MNENFVIKITMPIGRWNVIFNTMNRLVLDEVKAIANKIRPQLEGKTFENDSTELEVELTIEDTNKILALVKMLPFYDSYDIVTNVMAQGTAQIQAAQQAEQAPEPAAEPAPVEEKKPARKRKSKKAEEA